MKIHKQCYQLQPHRAVFLSEDPEKLNKMQSRFTSMAPLAPGPSPTHQRHTFSALPPPAPRII